jgi:hypothetical protein
VYLTAGLPQGGAVALCRDGRIAFSCPANRRLAGLGKLVDALRAGCLDPLPQAKEL